MLHLTEHPSVKTFEARCTNAKGIVGTRSMAGPANRMTPFGLLDHLLVVPNGLTVPMLKLHSAWDPLRKDTRFQALIDKHAGKH